VHIVRKSGLLVPKKNVDLCLKLKEFLTRYSRTYGKSDYTISMFYQELEDFILVPRYLDLTRFWPSIKVIDKASPGQRININHNIVPRSKVQKKFMQYMLSNRNGILKLQPGTGKTVISIYMIAERKRKAFILVHRKSLLDQWIERLLQFTNLKESSIATLSSGTFQDDLQKDIIISTDQTFISLLKRKKQQFLKAINRANIGVFVADEVHTSVGAPTFSQCSIHIPAKYTFGLSATPYRYDGNGDIIKFHLGKVVSDYDHVGVVPVKISVVLLDYQIDTPYRYKYLHWSGQFQLSRYLNLIRKSEPFLSCTKQILTKLKNRNVILIAERVKLIKDLYDWYNGDKSMFCGTATLTALKNRVTFATPGKCRDGIDAPWKDTLVITSPISNIEQLVGRVIRSHKDKSQASVIDMVDYGCSTISNTYFTRRKFYLKKLNKGWKINYFLFKNNSIKPIDEDIAMEIILNKR